MSAVIVFVADAGPSVGAGHVVRCLTLANAFKVDGQIPVLLSKQLPDQLAKYAESLGVKTIPRKTALSYARIADEIGACGPHLVVLDGYSFTSRSLSSIGSLGAPTLVVDDNAETDTSHASWVLNQNISAKRDLYPLLKKEQLMLGLDWALIRPSIRRLSSERSSGLRRGVVVALGGGDLSNLNDRIVEGLVELGISARSPEQLLDVNKSLSLVQLAEMLAESQLAVIGGGSTLWETGYLGTPALSLVAAPNQVALASGAVDAGFAMSIDIRSGLDPGQIARHAKSLLDDDALLVRMSSAGQSRIDGFGAERVVAKIRDSLVPPH